jgi:hypothetical protein
MQMPEKSNGEWTISKFTVPKEMAKFGALRMALGHARDYVPEGDYYRLMRGRTLVMSSTPAELSDLYELEFRARGNCIIHGLGLGCTVYACLEKKGVDKLTVIEISQDLIDLVGPIYKQRYGDRLEIICADALEWNPPRGARYDMVWSDIWDNICADNIKDFSSLRRKYSRKKVWHGIWAEDEARRGR